MGDGNGLGVTLQTVGQIFVQLLKVLVPPLVFTAIVASIAALRAYGPVTAYQTTKAGILGLTISLAGQLADQRIRVNAIAPGQVWTPLVAEFMSPQLRDERRQSGLIQDEGTAWDVAWGAVYLASDEARCVTGQVLVIDGGVTLTMRGGNRPG